MKNTRWDELQSLVFGAGSGAVAGLIADWCEGPVGRRIDAAVPSAWAGNTTSQLIVGAMFLAVLFVLPPILTAFSRRYSFVWGFLPPLTCAVVVGARLGEFAGTIAAAVALTSGPVAAVRYVRSKPERFPPRAASAAIMSVAALFAVLWGVFAYVTYRTAHPVIRTPAMGCRSLSFVAKVSFARPNAGTWTELAPGPTYRVEAVRPGSLRIQPAGVPTPGAPFGKDIYVTDGRGQLACSAADHGCALWPIGVDLPTAGRIRGPVGLIDTDIVFADQPVRGWHSNGVDIAIDGRQVSPYIRRQIEHNIEHMQRLYIGKDGLPVRYSDYEPNHAGHFIEVRRTDFSDWRLNPSIAPSTFELTPPAGFKMIGSSSRNAGPPH